MTHRDGAASQPHLCLLVRRPFELRFRADIERLDNTGVNRCNDIDSAIQIFFRDSGFPCVRKAAFDSRLTVAYAGHGQPHKHLLALSQVIHRMGIAVKLSKIGPLSHKGLLSSGLVQ